MSSHNTYYHPYYFEQCSKPIIINTSLFAAGNRKKLIFQNFSSLHIKNANNSI